MLYCLARAPTAAASISTASAPVLPSSAFSAAVDTTLSIESNFPVLKDFRLAGSERRCNTNHFGGDKNIASAERRLQASAKSDTDQSIHIFAFFHYIHRGPSQFRPRTIGHHRHLRAVQPALPREIQRPIGLC